MHDFHNKTVLVSGGTSGIGAAIAKAFSHAGATVHALGLETGLNVTEPASIDESVIANLRVGAENFSAAKGRIVDADYAQETSNLSRAQVLQQAGTAMVAQANQGPQGVLALLR